MPDILRAFERDAPVVIRNPHATRPWQHVLEPLSGYLTLAERLYEHGQAYAEGWNFGPAEDDAQPVQWIVERMVRQWSGTARWQIDGADHPHEANYLKLDIAKARHRLAWTPRWSLDAALARVVEWHRHWLAGADMQAQCLAQIDAYTQSSTRTCSE